MKISRYSSVAPIKGDLLIGTNVDNDKITKNFAVEDIAGLSTLATVLAAGNTATNNITLTGDLTIIGGSTFDTVIVEDISVEGTLSDGDSVVGTAGQVLSSTGTQVQWVDASAPTPTLAQVLTAGDTATNDLTLSTKDSDLIVEGGQVFGIATVPISVSVFNTTLDLNFGISDGADSYGTVGQVLSSNSGSAPTWITSPSYVLNMTAESVTTQSPSAVDTPLQLTLGSAQLNSNVVLDVAGLITFIEAGNYRISLSCSFGRGANAGQSNTQFAILYDSAGGVPATYISPTSIYGLEGNSAVFNTHKEDLILTVVANSTLAIRMNNDSGSSGDNNASCLRYTGQAGSLNTSPSVSVLIYKSE